MNAESQFRDAILAAGLTPPSAIEADGKLRRFASNGKRGDDAGWYLLHGDGIPAGCFGDWRTGLSQTWRADIGRALTPAEEAAHRNKAQAMRRTREAEEARRKTGARTRAAAIWQRAPSAPDDHAYLIRKGIKANGARLYKDALLIPMRATGELHSLQFIGTNGDKRFLSGGRVAGCYYSIGSMKDAAALAICEGFATGASIHEATSYPVCVAFNAGNLDLVAKAMREKFPDLRLIVCADDDYLTDGNPGLTHASEAALSVGGMVAVPNFGTNRPDKTTDFNDMAALMGLEAVRLCIEAATSLAKLAPLSLAIDKWPEPQPLAVKVEPEPYPIDALPSSIRAAVEEVAGFVKAPLPMLASSAVAALSLAIQSHADVKRAEKLHGPVGLFLLIIADSGERKSTSDGFFTQAIRDYVEAQAEAAKPIIKDHMADIGSWEAKRSGIKDKIRQLSKESRSTASMESALRDLEQDKPEPPRIPRLLFTDATPEALAFGLATRWPSGGVVSAEAGIVFGSHGMGKDSAMRNLALLNQLWDGNSLTIDRRTTESFTVRGARLTVALQVQEPTLREFFNRSGALARGTGFLARFLVAWPESTQGFRPFTEAPENWPHLAAFNKRIAAILSQPVPIDGDGALTPPMLTMRPDAKAAWIKYHNAIESELASGGELYDVRDVASKSADNAARLAALFQIFEHGLGDAIAPGVFEGASRIAAWHLNEARRFFGELALPAELANAARLDSWLIEYCRRERTHLVPIAKLQQCGPSGLRSKAAIETAMRELEEAARARILRDGRLKQVVVNPALIATPMCVSHQINQSSQRS
jgi:putative DNA primase/helicase